MRHNVKQVMEGQAVWAFDQEDWVCLAMDALDQAGLSEEEHDKVAVIVWKALALAKK